MVPFNDVEQLDCERSHTFNFDMQYLKKSQRRVCTGEVNLGVTDVKVTKAIGMGKIIQKQNVELIKVKVFDSFVRPPNTRRLSNIYFRRDD